MRNITERYMKNKWGNSNPMTIYMNFRDHNELKPSKTRTESLLKSTKKKKRKTIATLLPSSLDFFLITISIFGFTYVSPTSNNYKERYQCPWWICSNVVCVVVQRTRPKMVPFQNRGYVIYNYTIDLAHRNHQLKNISIALVSSYSIPACTTL